MNDTRIDPVSGPANVSGARGADKRPETQRARRLAQMEACRLSI